MIEVIYRDRLGNNLFQYCLGRVLAEKLGLRLKADPIPGFPNTFCAVPGNDYSSHEALMLTGHEINLNGIAENYRKQKIILSGHFQRYEYYKSYRSAIRNEWLILDSGVGRRDIKIHHEDLVFHVRLGDYFKHGAVLPFSWYKHLLRTIKYRRLFIVTDEPGNPYLLQFKKYKPIIICAASDPFEDFKFITRFNKIVQSQSTFSWWASYLSDATEIYAPIPLKGFWSDMRPDIKLQVDESRYRYILCREPYKPCLTERTVKIYQKIRRKMSRIKMSIRERINP